MTQRIGKHKTRIEQGSGGTEVRYHGTAVVSFNDNEITLRTGGWKTATTKKRMNQTSDQFDLEFNVYQKSYQWFVVHRGQTVDFDGDSLTLQRFAP